MGERTPSEICMSGNSGVELGVRGIEKLTSSWLHDMSIGVTEVLKYFRQKERRPIFSGMAVVHCPGFAGRRGKRGVDKKGEQ